MRCYQMVTIGPPWEKEAASMAAKVDVKSLPACPVETTLTLIGDKWKVLDPPGS